MVTAKQIINSTKQNSQRVEIVKTPLGEVGYDNARDDIERVKKMREGSIEKVPTLPNDIVNKLYCDSNIPTGATGSWTAGSGETITATNGIITFITSATFFILLENDDFLLLEIGDKIING